MLYVLEHRKQGKAKVFDRKLEAVYEHCKHRRRDSVKLREVPADELAKVTAGLRVTNENSLS